MGAANIACSFFGAVPGSSSFARSAVNFQSGARTQMSSMLSSLVVLGVLAFVTPVFNFIPIAALAAHLIRIGFKMINWHQIRVSCRSTPSDLVVFVVTLGSCLFLRLDTAIYVGIGVSLALFLRATSTPTLVEYAINESGNLVGAGRPGPAPPPPDLDHPRRGRALLRRRGPLPGAGPQPRRQPEHPGLHPADEERPPPGRLDRHGHGVPARLPPQDRPPPAHQREQPRRHARAGEQRAPAADRQGEHLPGRGESDGGHPQRAQAREGASARASRWTCGSSTTRSRTDGPSAPVCPAADS